MEQFLNLDITQLSYGALFVWLLLHTTKRNQEREDKLTNTLSQIVPTLEKINNRLDSIEEKIEG